MATDTWTSASSGSWTTAGSWSGGVPTSTSDVIIGSSANNTTVTSAANVTVKTIMINSGDQLDVTSGSTFTDTNASNPGGTFGVVELDTGNFVIGNGVYDNSGNFTFNSTTASQSTLAISGSVSFDGAGFILLSATGTAGAGSNIITSQSGVATLTDVDNNLSGTGTILGINFINETTVETGSNGILILWGDVAGGAFNNENLLKADTGGTLILGNGADNTVDIANTGTIDLNNTIASTTTKMEITDNVIINGAGGGQIEFTGSNSGNGNEIVSDGTHTPVSLTLNGGELTGPGTIGDSFLSLKLQSFLIEETQVQLVIAAASTNIDAGSKIEASEGGEIFLEGPVTNSGTLNVLSGGIIFVTGSITDQNAGVIDIGPGGTLFVNHGSIEGIVQFTGSGGVLKVSADHLISNSIAGAVRGDGFDLTYETFDPGFQVVWLQASGAGTIELEKNGVVQTTVSLAGQYTSSDFEAERDTDGNTIIEVIGNPSPPPATTGDMVMRNPGGNFEIYDLGNNAILAAYSLGQVGTEWAVAGIGGFFGSDTSDIILRNGSTGQFEIYDVGNNTITNAASMGQVGLEWQVAGFGDFSSRVGESDMLMRDSSNGQFEIYDLANNKITSAASMGQVGTEWQVAGFGDFSTRAGESDMLMRNTATGAFEIYDISNNQLTSAASMGQVGLEWQVVGFGDFSGNANETDMLMRNGSSGAFEIYDIRNNQLASAASMGQVGTEWQVAGFGPINGAGASDMLMRNGNTGAFEVYDIANNQLTTAASMGQVGTEWQVSGIAATPTGVASAQLAQAMASFDAAGGALDSSSPLGDAAQTSVASPTVAPAGELRPA